MAQHPFCEANQANWHGIRPGIDGDDLISEGYAINQTVTRYTVPAGYVLYLFDYCVSYNNSSGVARVGSFNAYTAAAVLKARLSYARFVGDGSDFHARSFFLPHMYDAGDYFVLMSSGLLFEVRTTIHGILSLV